MDWIRDNVGISANDIFRVFKYEPKSSTVVRILGSETHRHLPKMDRTEPPTPPWRPVKWSLNETEWKKWLEEELPEPVEGKSGLVLIFARRTGKPAVSKVLQHRTCESQRKLDDGQSRKPRKLSFLADMEKLSDVVDAELTPNPPPIQRRSLRVLPFSPDVFECIAHHFRVHGSIARTISRTDVPIFSATRVEMGRPAIVYNCRSSNAWEMDLALTVTYFPHCRLSYAILFGCPLSVEEEVMNRLSMAADECHHPLLLPGIFAELERVRHIKEVEKTINELEARITELDFASTKTEGRDRAVIEKHNQEKRSAWLDTTYLRNSLITWSTQLRKMAGHEKELSCGIFRPRSQASLAMSRETRELSPRGYVFIPRDLGDDSSLWDGDDYIHDLEQAPFDGSQTTRTAEEEMEVEEKAKLEEQANRDLRKTGRKIRSRLAAIIEEYDDKIRDCTMRVDGMAMATQWANGETNVEIALATSRDSQHMRSIALITMIFLPGTFLASVFSMTFFDWSEQAVSHVSPSIWIYVVITTIVTLLTVGSWYFWVVLRHLNWPKKVKSSE